MKVKILIPILNPENSFFEDILPMLFKQTLKCEVILINSGKKLDSTDKYRVINIDKRDFNHANTRNMALGFDADFYVFMTQDAKPFDEFLMQNLLKVFSDEDVAVSYARQIPYDNAHITEKFARGRNYPDRSIVKSKYDMQELGIKTFFSSDSCAMYRGDYFREKNGFKRDLNISEDMEFAARAVLDNKKIAYCSEAKVYHSHVYKMGDLFKRYVEIGRFFKENAWIQESIKMGSSTEKTGAKQALEELKYVAKNKPSAFVKSFLFIVVKYVGYKLGRR